MSAPNEMSAIVEELAFLAAERATLYRNGPLFRITHRFHTYGQPCASGEDIAGAHLAYRVREYPVPLAMPLRVLFDYFGRHTRLPQSARQIEAGIAEDRFYTYPVGRRDCEGLSRGIPRAYVRVYVERTREALRYVFEEACIPVDPCSVLVSEETAMNEIGYRLHARVEWRHTEL